jgi:hypothetical protein
MAKFRFDHYIDIHWNGYDIVGDGGTIFSIPDQLYEEFEADLRPVEPSLEWTVVNEFLELQNAVSVTTLEAVAPIVVTPTSTGRSISLNANYSTTSHLHDGTYQPFGTYVASVSGTAPITTSGTTAITVGVDQTSITANSATNASVLRAYVKNSTGTTLNKGQVVYISGSDGANALISLSSASSEAGSSKTLGLLAQTLTTGSQGYVIENGLLADIDTSAATAGQSVWLGDTPGSFVFGSPPAEPSHSVYLGVVTRVQQNNGEILVKVQNGYELDELHDVSAASPSDGDIIQYKTSSSLWTKASIANAGIASSVHTHPYQPAGTYVTAVNGSAPIAASTDTAGIVSVSLTATYSSSTHDHSGVYQVAGNYATDTHTHTLPPTGSIVMWATSSAPSGWLFLDGSTYSQATYPDLAAVFGVVSGTFTLPDMRDRFVGGLSVVGALTNNAGTFAPNTANTHDHTTNIAHGHADTIAVNTHGDHTHTTDPAATTSGSPSTQLTSITQTGSGQAGSNSHTHSTNIAATASGAENTNLTHTVTGGVTSLGATSVTSSSGSLTPKSTLLNFIIKT